MFQQPMDFRDESEALYATWRRSPTPTSRARRSSRRWTINDVVSHLHVWNWAADLSLADPERFVDFRTSCSARSPTAAASRAVEADWLDGAKNRARLEQWRELYLAMTERFLAADPKQRVAWAGPDMSVRSSISARLMETWAHSQEVYDSLGRECAHTDRIKNIADLGVRTFGWAYVNRGRAVPAPVPYVRLTAPSGAVWSGTRTRRRTGSRASAVDFCKVVTQTRNVADTGAPRQRAGRQDWMTIVQCFAGPPEDPPAPGTPLRAVMSLALLANPESWVAFVTLIALEIVLGIDNIIFISILAGKLPGEQQRPGARHRARARDDHAHPAAALALLDRAADRAALRGAAATRSRGAT